MSVYIAVDVGGTHIRAASYDKTSLEPIKHSRIKTQQEEISTFDRLVTLISSVYPESQPVTSIAVAAPGPVDPLMGMILSTPNIPGWKNFPLKNCLMNKFDVPVFLGNDANLAALGEWKYGAARGHHDVIYLTISTGIGSGIISNDNLILGSRGLGAELGHVTILPNGPICSCGKRGHLEAIASGPAIARWFEEQITLGEKTSLSTKTAPTAKDIAGAAKSGDRLSIAALERAATYIGNAVADFLHIFNPTIVIFGGGVSNAGSLLLNPITQAVHTRVMDPEYVQSLILTTAALGDDAGLMGALALARQND